MIVADFIVITTITRGNRALISGTSFLSRRVALRLSYFLSPRVRGG